MFQSTSRLQELGARMDQLEAELQLLRRQIESVGKAVGNAPRDSLSAAAGQDGWREAEARLSADIQALAARVEALVQAPLDAATVRVSPPPEEPETVKLPVADDFDLGLRYVPQRERVEAPPAGSIPEQLAAIVADLVDQAPQGLAEMLQSSLDALNELAERDHHARDLQRTGRIELVLKLVVEPGPDAESHLDEAYGREKSRVLAALSESDEEREQRLLTVTRRDVPAIVDLCDSARRQFDTTTPFFAHLDSRLEQLMSLCSLESIEPEHGQTYDPSEHTALDLIETDDPALKDHVESCRYRGYRHRGTLLKKAGVVIYR